MGDRRRCPTCRKKYEVPSMRWHGHTCPHCGSVNSFDIPYKHLFPQKAAEESAFRAILLIVVGILLGYFVLLPMILRGLGQ